jgi:hypothetical protein
MKKPLMIIGVIALVLVFSAGSFYGGMAYARNQASQIRSQFLASRGQGGNGAFNGGANGATGQRQGLFGGGGGTTGQVKTINGNVLTISTAQNVTTVNISSSTQIEKAAPGATSDLTPGERVLVTGQRDSSGNIAASQILILPDLQTNNGTTP